MHTGIYMHIPCSGHPFYFRAVSDNLMSDHLLTTQELLLETNSAKMQLIRYICHLLMSLC